MLETVSFADRPEAIAEQPCDCLWIVLSPRSAPTPAQNRLVEWLDWRLLGKISRYLAQGGSERTTFFPGATPDLAARMVAVDRLDQLDWKKIRENLVGMKAQSVVFLFESWDEAGTQKEKMEKALEGSIESFRMATERDLALEKTPQ